MISNILNKFRKSKSPISMYVMIGEEKGTYELVKIFYEIMESDPHAKDCLETHELINGIVPDEVKKKLFMFLCGWFGGPNLFVETYGHPRMKARHHHVKIGEIHRDQWIYCIQKAIDLHSYKISKKNKLIMMNSFKALAQRIQNQF